MRWCKILSSFQDSYLGCPANQLWQAPHPSPSPTGNTLHCNPSVAPPLSPNRSFPHGNTYQIDKWRHNVAMHLLCHTYPQWGLHRVITPQATGRWGRTKARWWRRGFPCTGDGSHPNYLTSHGWSRPHPPTCTKCFTPPTPQRYKTTQPSNFVLIMRVGLEKMFLQGHHPT